jgi:hypothetical protein
MGPRGRMGPLAHYVPVLYAAASGATLGAAIAWTITGRILEKRITKLDFDLEVARAELKHEKTACDQLHVKNDFLAQKVWDYEAAKVKRRQAKAAEN